MGIHHFWRGTSPLLRNWLVDSWVNISSWDTSGSQVSGLGYNPLTRLTPHLPGDSSVD